MAAFAKVVYGLFGVLSLAAGLFVIVSPSAIVEEGDPGIVPHLLQEQAAAFVFIGLMCLWCIRHFPERRPVHGALFLFTLLYAAVHWWGVLHGETPSAGGYATLVPVLLLAATWPRTAPR